MKILLPCLLAALLTGCAHTEKSACPCSEPDKNQYEEWDTLDFWEPAVVEVAQGIEDSWEGQRAAAGTGIAIQLDKGSHMLGNTTAHPQYKVVWLQLAANPPVGQWIKLRTRRDERPITRTKQFSKHLAEYSQLDPGELTLSGMEGYDIPVPRHDNKTVGRLKILERTQDSIKVHLILNIPYYLPLDEEKTLRYEVDRVYELKRKPLPES
jgi:hypothetical protein